jgi:hypothetical protein
MVLKPSKVGEKTALKKASNRSEELPDWVNAKWFRQTFVTTYMAYVGQLMDPWDMPPKLAVKTMQKIWDVTDGKDYEITTTTAVYQKVRSRFALDHILMYIF